MFGQFCKGLWHFEKNVKDNKKTTLFILDDYALATSNLQRLSLAKATCQRLEDGRIIISGSYWFDGNHTEEMDCAFERPYFVYNPQGDNKERGYFNDILMPKIVIIAEDGFEESYTNFINTNKKKTQQLINVYGENESQFAYLLSNGSVNFYVWIIKNLFSKNISPLILFYILKWYELYPNCSSLLSKNTITAYNGIDNMIQLTKEVNSIMTEKRVKNSLMEFNTLQKNLLRNNLDNDTKGMLNLFYKLPFEVRKNFIKKVSSIKETEELRNNLRLICEYHYKWNKESFFEYLTNTKNLNYKVVYDKNNIVIINVFDFDTIRKLAKTTNWCIGKNKIYWNDFIGENRKQYVIFNFNEEVNSLYSIIGVTTNEYSGIIMAHAFNNDNLFVNDDDDKPINYEVYFTKQSTNIYSILKEWGIDTNIFNPNFIQNIICNWDIETFSKYFETTPFFIENAKILKKTKNTIVISCNDLNNVCKYLFKDDDCTLNNNLNNELESLWQPSKKYGVLFFNFGESISDDEKFYLSCNNLKDNTPYSLYNAFGKQIDVLYFHTLARKYGLPKMFGIKRSTSILHKIYIALDNFDEELFKSFTKNKTITPSKANLSEYNITQLLIGSLMNQQTFRVYDIIYNNGFTISSLIREQQTREVVEILSERFNSCFNVRKRHKDSFPTQEEYDMFENHKFENNTVADEATCKMIAIEKTLRKMLTNEPSEFLKSLIYNDLIVDNDNYFYSFIKTINGTFIAKYYENFIKLFITHIIKTEDYELLCDILKNNTNDNILEFIKQDYSNVLTIINK